MNPSTLARSSARSPRPRRTPVPAAATLAVLVVVLAFSAGCRCLRGPVNASPGLRWWLFSNFGASKVCPELTGRGVGLKLQDRGPSVGRFFPRTCKVDVNSSNNTMTVHFTGTGYATIPVSGRVGFSAQASIEYRPEFYMAEDDIYVWGKVNRIVHGPTFQLGYVENKVAGLATSVSPFGNFTNVIGQQIAAGELTRGFTVVQDYDTESNTFAMGILNPPMKPHTPYQVTNDDAHTYANETIEVGYQQRDYLGPFKVVDNDQRLKLRVFHQGPDVEAMVVARAIGDPWRDHYQVGQPLGPPPGPVLAGTIIRQGPETKVAWRLPKGEYYIVIDHTSYAGQVNPPSTGLVPGALGPAGRLSYVVQLVED